MILGLGLAWIARLIRQEGGRFLLAAEMARRGLGMLLYLSVFAVVEALLEGWATELRGAELAAFMVAGASWFVLDTWLWASLTYGRRVVSRRYLWLLAISDWMVALSLMATGALFAFSWRPLGPWAVLVAAVPYSFAHAGVHRYHMARRTYRQTIRALARIPEVAGLSGDGHAERTAELAVLTSQEMGLGPDLVSQIEYAALMHDIGRITLNEPTILRMGFTDEDIAGWGADIVAEAPYLSRVATFVRHQHQPYRRPGEHSDPDLPIASKIIRAASAYDHAVGELGFSALEGLETLHRGAAYDFDPDVVAAMRRVVAAGTVSGEGRSRLRP